MNNSGQPATPPRLLLMIVGGVCLVLFMAIYSVRSIVNLIRAPPASMPVVVVDMPLEEEAGHVTPEASPPVAALPALQTQKPRKNVIINFDQMIQIEQEKRQIYRALREQAQANPGGPSTLTEEEIRKLENEGETGDMGFP